MKTFFLHLWHDSHSKLLVALRYYSALRYGAYSTCTPMPSVRTYDADSGRLRITNSAVQSLQLGVVDHILISRLVLAPFYTIVQVLYL